MLNIKHEIKTGMRYLSDWALASAFETSLMTSIQKAAFQGRQMLKLII